MKKLRKETGLSICHPNAAGIDIGSVKHYVAVPSGRPGERVRSFGCFTEDLYDLLRWLQECKIDTVAMESTSVYWIPLFRILEANGIEVYLVNVRKSESVPGRQTDVKDCQWLQELRTYGLLQASFQIELRLKPPRQIVDFIIGKRTKATLKELIGRLLLLRPKVIRTDRLTVYQRIIQ